MAPLLGIRPPGSDSTGNVVVLSRVNRDYRDNGTKGCHITDNVPYTAIRSWCSALSSAVREGSGSAELKLFYKLLETTEMGTAAIKFPYTFVA